MAAGAEQAHFAPPPFTQSCFQLVVLPLSFCEAQPPAEVVDDDVNVVGVFGGRGGAVEVEMSLLNSRCCSRAAALGREVVLIRLSPRPPSEGTRTRSNVAAVECAGLLSGLPTRTEGVAEFAQTRPMESRNGGSIMLAR
jgi:hypothetical protein